MFRISNDMGYQVPYWGHIDRVQAIQALEDRGKKLWELKPEGITEKEKIKKVHNYRFVKEEREEKEEEEAEHHILAVQIMSFPVVTLTPEQTLEDAWDIMNKTRFRHIPVVNENGMVVGILSDRTLFRELHAHGGKALVKEVMKTKVITAMPDTAIRHIAQIFVIERIGSMPITDEAGRLVGIITRSDVLRTALHFL